MSIARAVLSFFGLNSFRQDTHEALKAGYGKRTLTLVHPEHVPVAAEVDNERQRYTAKRYIEHLKACENGDRRGFKEWSRFILSMKYQRPDDYASFFLQVDGLIARGELWNVLTPEEEEERKRNVLAKLDVIMADSLRPMHETVGELTGQEIEIDHGTFDPVGLELPEWPDLGDEEFDAERGDET